MKSDKIKQKCRANVADQTWRGHQCTRNAVVVREGEPYCNLHDPVKKQLKRKEKQKQVDIERDVRRKKWERQNLLLELAIGIETEELENYELVKILNSQAKKN